MSELDRYKELLDLLADAADLPRVGRDYGLVYDALLADVRTARKSYRSERVCATCRWLSDDGERAECINPDSPMYRVYKAADREDWKDVWGCVLWARH